MMPILSTKKEKVKALKNGKGIQYILDEACKILENPTVMFNMSYELQAYNKNVVTDDPIWNEIIATGTFCDKTLKFFKNEGFIDAVANVEKVTFLSSDKLKYDRICGNVFNSDNIPIANLTMVACNRPFEDDDYEAFEAMCDKISQEIKESEFYQEYGKIYEETLVSKLIAGSIKDKGLYSGHVANIYKGLKKNLYLAVLDITNCDSTHSQLAYFRDLLKRVNPEFKYTIYDKYIIIIISTDAEKLNISQDLNKLEQVFEENNINVGISSCFDNLFALRKYYFEALEALSGGLNNNDNSTFAARNP